jgi:hypothetical protein
MEALAKLILTAMAEAAAEAVVFLWQVEPVAMVECLGAQPLVRVVQRASENALSLFLWEEQSHSVRHHPSLALATRVLSELAVVFRPTVVAQEAEAVEQADSL